MDFSPLIGAPMLLESEVDNLLFAEKGSEIGGGVIVALVI